MANCTMCGSSLGILNTKAADMFLFDEFKQAGLDVPQGICSECAPKLIEKLRVKAAEKQQALDAATRPIEIPNIPVYTSSPNKFDGSPYIGLASAHVALGTGPLSQILSSVTDLFGQQSNTYSDKMREAENACLAKLKLRAHEMGADAVIGVHTTYTELTSGHGMLLVCMTGTAVKKGGGNHV